MIYPDLSVTVPQTLSRVHCIGIGGSGVSGIARMLHEAGVAVSGSDATENANVRALRELGIPIEIGHRAETVTSADRLDAVVVTGALWPDNPEVLAARERGVPVLHRAQALNWLIGKNRLVSVAGAHGKTTSTGMIVTALRELGQDPSFVNGGVIESYGVSAASGTDPLCVIEADESDGSFLIYDTQIALITNVDPEHLDFYGSRERFMQAFVDFAGAAAECVVLSADDPGTQEVRARLTGQRVLTFGEAATADVRLHSVRTDGPVSFSITCNGVDASAKLRVPGHHNAVNAAGAIAVLVALGVDLAAAVAAVAAFGGTKRRFEHHATVGGVQVYDDYAHHPTEVGELLRSARTVAGSGRIIAVHQPHLFSRTQHFCGEFAAVLEAGAEFTVVLPVCGAREDPVPGVTGALVSERFVDQGRVAYIEDWRAAANHIARIARPGDFVITMGCGDVYRAIPDIVAALRER